MGRPTRPSLWFAAVALCAAIPGRAAWPDAAARIVYAGVVRTVDPALATGPGDERVVLACFEGLTVLDPATGQVKPGAAERWEVSPDGRTWTFTLRDAKWMRKFGDSFEAKGNVTAQDFVFAWRRLLDPATQSPHVDILDVLPGVTGLSVHQPRRAALDRILSDLDSLIGRNRKTLSGEQVGQFLADGDRNARRWLGELAAPEAKEFLDWSPSTPYQGVRAVKLMDVLAKERDRSLAIEKEADEHVGVDRAFFAKDEKTLVVQTAGLSPWLPSLVSRAALVPVHPKTVERTRDQAFNKRQNFVGNGAYVADTDFPLSETNESGENTPFKVVLLKNPSYWNAAAVAAEHLECLVHNGEDEVLRQYANGDVQWVEAGALTLETSRGIRAARAPGWQPKKEAEKVWKAFCPDTYDTASGAVYVLRFRCAPPLEKPDARRALAALIDRDALATKAGSPTPPPTTRRFVNPRASGILPSVRVPAFDASKALALYGPRKFTSDVGWISIVCSSEEDTVADAIGKAWKAAKIPDDVSTTVKTGKDFLDAIDAGTWDAAVGTWYPAYDDPLAFLSAFTTKNPLGDTQWSSPAYDALVQGALDVQAFVAKPDAAVKDLPAVKAALASAKDAKGLEDLRRTLLAEAESILLDEAVVVPLWLPTQSGLAKPGLKGLTLTAGRPRSMLDVGPLTSLVYQP